MYNIEYGYERRFLARWLGIDIATGSGQDFSALCLIDQYEVKIKQNDFDDDYDLLTKFEVIDLQRSNTLGTDEQIEFFTKYVEGIKPSPYICVDATRELALAVALRNNLKNSYVHKVIWSGGSAISKTGSKYVASKVQALLDMRSMVALNRLTVADIPLRDELRKEIMGLVFNESESGGFTVKSGSKNDDLCMAMACCLVPLLHRGVLERRPARAITSISPPASYYTGAKLAGI